MVVRKARVRGGGGEQRVALVQQGAVRGGPHVGDDAVGEAQGQRLHHQAHPAQPPVLDDVLVGAEGEQGGEAGGGDAGAAREHFWVLVVGLVFSVGFMGLAASAIARLLQNNRWIAYVGLALIVYVAGKMIWDGAHQVAYHL